MGGSADMLLENNQATNIVVRRFDSRLQRNENTAYSGVLIKGNRQASGVASTVQSVEGIPAGVTVLP